MFRQDIHASRPSVQSTPRKWNMKCSKPKPIKSGALLEIISLFQTNSRLATNEITCITRTHSSLDHSYRYIISQRAHF